MKSQAAIVTALTALMLSGCTELKTARLSSDSPDFPDNHIPYSLPQKSFVISTSYTLKKCSVSSADKLESDIGVEVAVVQVNGADKSQRYYIDYQALRSTFKDTDVTVELHPNQTLKSLNATITDQVGPVAVATASALIKAAATVALLAQDESSHPCSASARKALKDLDDLAKERRDIVAKATAEGKSAPPPSETDIIRKANALEALSHKQVIHWTPAIGQPMSERIFPPVKALDKWFSCKGQFDLKAKELSDLPVRFQREPTEEEKAAVEYRQDHECEVRTGVKRKLTTGIRAFTPFVIEITPMIPLEKVRTLPAAILQEGLVVRSPVLSRMRICQMECPTLSLDGKLQVSEVENVLYSADELIPQFGNPVLLRLRNGINEKSVLNLTMTDEGVLTKIGIASTSTTGTAITGLGSAADTARTLSEARTKAKAEAETTARNSLKDANKRLADCLVAQKTVKDNGGIPIGVCE